MTKSQNKKLALWFLIVTIACILCHWLVDEPTALYIKANLPNAWMVFFKIVTVSGDAGVYLIPATLAWLALRASVIWTQDDQLRERMRKWSYAPGLIVLSVATSGVLVNILKVAIGRYRPRHLFNDGIYGFEPFNAVWAMNSFPSGHSQAAFAAMTALCFIFPRYWPLWLTIAFTAALSRIAITVHYVSDTFMGSYLGIAICIMLVSWMRSRGYEPRLGLPLKSDQG